MPVMASDFSLQMQSRELNVAVTVGSFWEVHTGSTSGSSKHFNSKTFKTDEKWDTPPRKPYTQFSAMFLNIYYYKRKRKHTILPKKKAAIFK